MNNIGDDNMNNVKYLLPAYNNKNVTIILSSSNMFSMYLAVCLKSIIDNSTCNYNYDIIIFEREISEINKKKIYALGERYSNISIRFFNVTNAMKKYKFFLNSNRISQETYYGLIIPFLLPNHKKGIIMDCDMIVKHDIGELYSVDLENHIIGGINDIVLQGWLSDKKNNDTYSYYTEYLQVKYPMKFINGGLLLIDFCKYRKDIALDQVSDYINNYKLRVVDQDIINILFDGDCKHIDYRWNHLIYVKGAISEAIAKAPNASREKYFKSQEKPYIIHYAGDFKPWNHPEIEFADEFWKYARETRFYEIILYYMIQNKMTEGIVCHQEIYHNGFMRKIISPYREEKLKRIAKSRIPNNSLLYKTIRRVYFKLIGRPYTE